MNVANLRKRINNNKYLLVELVRKDFQTKYLGSFLGILWAFIQPAIMILIFWFVFQFGFKTIPVKDFPYILWFMAGMLPWLFFSEAISNSTYSIISNSYLVKKVVFNISLLPIIKIISSLLVNLVFIVVLLIMFLAYGAPLNIYSLQIIYYMFALIVLIYALSLIASSLIVFFKDIGQIINMVLQFGFWITPIFWSFEMLPEKFHFLFKLNPLFYIIEGFRNSLIHYKWFWEQPFLTMYFWIFTGTLLIIGYYTFRKLKPHFPDVL